MTFAAPTPAARRLYAVDLFAGLGGASHGLHHVGYHVVGIELDKDAAATHKATGYATVSADIRTLDPASFVGVDHLHASPPCQTFSTAGKGGGRQYVDELAAAVKRVLHGENPADVVGDVEDERTLLTLEPARWIAATMPATISLEQVRAVLPIWQAYADALGDLGYSAWAGIIHAEQYGVPQSRARAWLGARRDGVEARPPAPTHSRYYPRTPDKLDPGVARWVTMADALDGNTLVGFPRRADSADIVTLDGIDYRASDLAAAGSQPAKTLTSKSRDLKAWELGSRRDSAAWKAKHGERRNRTETQPGPTITGEAHRWEWQYIAAAGRHNEGRPRHIDNPAPTITGKGTAVVGDESLAWEYRRPSTTVTGDPRLSGPGRNDPNIPGSQFNKPTSRRITITEALILQGFPADYPVQGSKTSQFKQVGNAVPPPVAAAVAAELTR